MTTEETATAKKSGMIRIAIDGDSDSKDEFFSGMSNDALRRDIAAMSDDELRREIAGLGSTLSRFRERLHVLLLEAEARKRKEKACSRPSAADRSGGVYLVSPPPAAAEAEGEGMSNDALRLDIAQMSNGELLPEIMGLRNDDNTHPGSSQPRLLPLLEAEARKRKANAYSRYFGKEAGLV